MEHSTEIAELAAALAAAQASIRPAAKDKENPHFRSRYADLSAVWEACRGPLTANGLSVVQTPSDVEGGRIALTTTLLHRSGQWLRSTFSVAPTKSDPQGIGSALTYARRYALAAMVGVVADEDDDGNAASAASAGQAKAQPQPAKGRQALAAGVALTRTQLTEIHRLRAELEWSEDDLRGYIQRGNLDPDAMTVQAAATLIDWLRAEIDDAGIGNLDPRDEAEVRAGDDGRAA